MSVLPKDLGGYQHLAPEVLVQAGDIYVCRGVPFDFVAHFIGERAGDAEENMKMNVYRLLPVPKQGDIDTSGWKTIRASAIPGAPSLPSTARARKDTPIASGFCDYFPLSMAEVSRVSKAGNDQHNPGKPLHWDRTKSGDESDALMRHFLERGTRDTDGQLHSAKLAWRSMALLEKELEATARSAHDE